VGKVAEDEDEVKVFADVADTISSTAVHKLEAQASSADVLTGMLEEAVAVEDIVRLEPPLEFEGRTYSGDHANGVRPDAEDKAPRC
jgi:hypothetical protein